MPSIRFLPLLACIMILGAGCSMQTAAAPTPLPGPTAIKFPTVRASKAAAATVPAQPSATTGPGQEVDVSLFDNKIQSSLTAFHAGVPYVFVVKNAGTHELCFDIGTPVNTTGSIGASQATALLNINQNRLPVGGTVKASFTFPASAVGAYLEFSCLDRRAYNDNVRLQITVTQ